MSKYFSLTLLIILPFLGIAQKLEYNLGFEGIGDNREYFSNYNEPQSILGVRTDFSVGTTVEDVHQFRIGLSYFYEFGSELMELDPHLIMYYNIEKDGWNFKIGAFPFKETLHYPVAILADDYLYFNATFDGLFIQKTGKNYHFNVWTDWVSRQDSVRREQFMSGFSGSSQFGNFMVEDYFYMFHNAGAIIELPNDYIRDYMGGLFLVGYDFSSYLPLDKLTLKTGVLTSLDRNRGVRMEYSVNNSSYTELIAEKKGFGVEAIFRFGDEHNFSHGDAFYNNTTTYHRVNLYFTPINFDKVKGRFVWSLHFANGDLDNQQQFILSYQIGS